MRATLDMNVLMQDLPPHVWSAGRKTTGRRDMTISERIHEKLRGFPEPVQREVLDFVEYLTQKLRKEDEEWS